MKHTVYKDASPFQLDPKGRNPCRNLHDVPKCLLPDICPEDDPETLHQDFILDSGKIGHADRCPKSSSELASMKYWG